MRRTALMLSLIAVALAFGAQAQEACPDVEGFVAEIFSNSLTQPASTQQTIQWQRLDNPSQSSPNLSLTWSPSKQKSVFRAAADRFWNRTGAAAPLPAPQPTPMITTAASVFSIDPNLTQKHRAMTQGFAVAQTQTTDPRLAVDANDLSLTYLDPRALSSLNASWITPWWGLSFAGAFRYISGETDVRVGKSFRKVTLFAECNNCTNRTTTIISTDVSSDGSFAPSMPRFFVIAARVDF